MWQTPVVALASARDRHPNAALVSLWNPPATRVLRAFVRAVLVFSGCATASAQPEATTIRVVWRRDILPGYSRVVVGDERIVTLGHDATRERTVLAAFRAVDGAPSWEIGWRDPFAGDGHGPGPHATPRIAGGCVLALSAGGRVVCVDAVDGTERWARDLGTDYDAPPPDHGHAGTPAIVDGLVIVPVGADDAGYVALRLADGQEEWRSRGYRIGYAPPVVTRLAGRRQVLVHTKAEIAGLDPVAGDELWRAPHRGPLLHNVALSPLVVGPERSHVWTSTRSDARGSGSRCLRVTRAPGGGYCVEEVDFRRRDQVEPIVGRGAVVVGPTLFASFGEGRVARLEALDPITGAVRWSERGFGAVDITPLADGRLLLLGERGEVSVGVPGEDGFRVEARLRLESTRTWTAPTVVGDRAFVRDRAHLWALRIPESPS